VDNTAPLEAISERDIDLLLLEEMYASPKFVEWLINKVFGATVVLEEVLSANHSIFDADGESDIVLRFRDRSGVAYGILFENKVNAPARPEQAARYRKRAETGAKEGKWVKSKIVIVAPTEYLKAKADGDDARISYEVFERMQQQTINDRRARART
jgi:hypothetical protein